MKVICNRGALLDALTVTGNVVAARTPKPVLQCVKLTASDGVAFGQFGRAVAVSGDFALVTANGSPPRPNGSMGALYAFSRTGTTWTQQPRIEPANPPANENFGFALALSNDTALVSGVATHVFVRTGTTWTEQPSIPLGGVALALSGGGALSTLETTVLLTVDETMAALRKAKDVGYRPPGA